jgi:hypothetical protein
VSTKRASFFRFRRNDRAKFLVTFFFKKKVTEDQHVAKNKGQFKQIKQFQPNIRINNEFSFGKFMIHTPPHASVLWPQAIAT